MEMLAEALSGMIKISEKETEQFLSFCYRKAFEKKELLSRDDDRIEEVYFICESRVEKK